MNTAIIYALSDPRTHEIRYVGLTRNLRLRLNQHRCAKCDNVHLRSWILSLRYAGMDFIVNILEIPMLQVADESERRWISRFRELGISLLNIAEGGEGAFRMSPETRRRLSDNKKQYYSRPDCTPSFFAKLNASRKGIPLSEEHRRRVSEGVRLAMTPEVRAKMGATRKGKLPYQMTKQTRDKISESLKLYFYKKSLSKENPALTQQSR